eukprot:14215823-Alexandrium_andersonii.AAC.1
MPPWTDWRPTSGRGTWLRAVNWRPGLRLGGRRCEAGLRYREAHWAMSRPWIAFRRDGIGVIAVSLP